MRTDEASSRDRFLSAVVSLHDTNSNKKNRQPMIGCLLAIE
jgi:hypothetical protein